MQFHCSLLALLSLLSVISLQAGIGSLWRYAQAASCAQQEQWPEAQQCMNQLLIDNPDDVALLYDSGVAAYRMKEFEKAEAYFNQALCCNDRDDQLKKQTHFNRGNTQCALKQLPEAIKSYEAVLAIDPEDERAKHNLEVVKQMLQQQQQQQSQDGANQDNQQDKKDQQQDQKKDSEQGQQSSQNKQQQHEKHERPESQQSPSFDTQEQQDPSEQEGDKDHDQSGGKQEEEQRANDQHEGDEECDPNEESDDKGSDQKQEQCSNHDSSPQTDSEQADEHTQRDSGFHNTHEEEKEQGMQEGTVDDSPEQDIRQQQHKQLEQELAPHERWMARVLQRREDADEKANKRMVKAAIDKELAGQHGQNCW